MMVLPLVCWWWWWCCLFLPLAIFVPPVVIVVSPAALLPRAAPCYRRATPCYRRAARRRCRAACRPASPCRQPWLIVMFSSPPRSILMALVVGGITHDPIKVRHQLEQTRAASTIPVASRRCIYCRRRRHRCRRRRRSSLSSLLRRS